MTRSHHPSLPAGPPPEVLEEIGAAWERAQVLVGGAYELQFASDASEAPAIACGDPVAVPV